MFPFRWRSIPICAFRLISFKDSVHILKSWNLIVRAYSLDLHYPIVSLGYLWREQCSLPLELGLHSFLVKSHYSIALSLKKATQDYQQKFTPYAQTLFAWSAISKFKHSNQWSSFTIHQYWTRAPITLSQANEYRFPSATFCGTYDLFLLLPSYFMLIVFDCRAHFNWFFH